MNQIDLSHPEDEHKYLLNGKITPKTIHVLLGSKNSNVLRHQFSIEKTSKGIIYKSREWDTDSSGIEFIFSGKLTKL